MLFWREHRKQGENVQNIPKKWHHFSLGLMYKPGNSKKNFYISSPI
jgi:hypothetical protein